MALNITYQFHKLKNTIFFSRELRVLIRNVLFEQIAAWSSLLAHKKAFSLPGCLSDKLP